MFCFFFTLLPVFLFNINNNNNRTANEFGIIFCSISNYARDLMIMRNWLFYLYLVDSGQWSRVRVGSCEGRNLANLYTFSNLCLVFFIFYFLLNCVERCLYCYILMDGRTYRISVYHKPTSLLFASIHNLL